MKMLISSSLAASVFTRGLWVAIWCCLALPSAFAKQYYTHNGDGVRGEYNAAELKFLAEFKRFSISKPVKSALYTSKVVKSTAIESTIQTGKTVFYSFVTYIAYLRRETAWDSFNAELLNVREQPNRWLRKVLGHGNTQTRLNAEPAPKTKPNEYRLHTGIKHATSRRSRYL